MTETIYRITNTINNDCYIGKTSDIKRRYKQHLSCASRNSQCYIHNAIRKYGKENFIIEELETTTELEVNNRERYWIALLHPKYNMTPGGDGHHHGILLSEETKLRISNSTLGRIPWNKGLTNCYKPEFYTKISIANRNRIAWNKGLPNSLAAENGRKGAIAQSLKVTGRKREYLPNGKWKWVYPIKNGS
jgi:group I intron endonuclease